MNRAAFVSSVSAIWNPGIPVHGKATSVLGLTIPRSLLAQADHVIE
jgi:hypothetical protein